MKLNLPVEMKNRNILLAGAGGGWDICGGLPLLYEWRETCKIVLANFSALVEGFDVRPAIATDDPEGKLAEVLGTPIYVFGKAGFRTLRAGYEKLLKDHDIDTIILVDGGVDSLMCGDEEGCGTIFQDTISVGVVDSLDVPTKILACVGFGTETDEGVCHYRALENIAALTKDGGLLGACALTANMEAFQFYEKVAVDAFALSKTQSHVHGRIIPAVHGEFGQYGPIFDLLSDYPPFVSPLAPVYWFFDVAAVARRNIWIRHFADTTNFSEVDAIHREKYSELKRKPRKDIPL